MKKILSKTSALELQHNIPSGITVFLVAVPLCLGIALACKVPLVSGLLTGLVGGIIVGALSNSPLSVAGPAAGLTSIVLASIQELGSFELLLAAIVIAGAIQIVFGVFKLGDLANKLPFCVIEGMMVAIGILLISKQAPMLWGNNGTHTFQTEAFIIATICLTTLYIWDKTIGVKIKTIPGPLVVVALSMLISLIFHKFFVAYEFDHTYFVNIPEIKNKQDFLQILLHPDWSAVYNFNFYKIAVTIALVASIETLLSIKAVDQIDPLRRTTNKNRELVAQGIGNVICGLIGGLPMTSVIVRSSVNVSSGARTRGSTIIHGCLILTSLILMASFMNQIPLVSLSSILCYTGYKLAHPKMIKKMWRHGYQEFLPFLVTVVVVVGKDLLMGVALGFVLQFLLVFIAKSKNNKEHTQHQK